MDKQIAWRHVHAGAAHAYSPRKIDRTSTYSGPGRDHHQWCRVPGRLTKILLRPREMSTPRGSYPVVEIISRCWRASSANGRRGRPPSHFKVEACSNAGGQRRMRPRWAGRVRLRVESRTAQGTRRFTRSRVHPAGSRGGRNATSDGADLCKFGASRGPDFVSGLGAECKQWLAVASTR